MPYCKECIQNLSFDEEQQTFDVMAFRSVLMQIDKPFIESALQMAIDQYNKTYDGKQVPADNRKKIAGIYLSKIGNIAQYKGIKNWEQGVEFNRKELEENGRKPLLVVEDGYSVKSEDLKKPEPPVRFSKADRQNMNYCISVVGYDPFLDCGMSELDRKQCFNILAGYCDADGIRGDSHKIQSVIRITQSQLQCQKLDEMINSELSSQLPNEKKIKDVTEAKSKLLASITQIVKDNNIASAYNKNARPGMNTLSAKMKQMGDERFEEIKVNLFDIKTSEAMKQVADLSNRSILDQLTFDANDYTEMIKEQRELLRSYESELARVTEELRLAKNRLAEYEEN